MSNKAKGSKPASKYSEQFEENSLTSNDEQTGEDEEVALSTNKNLLQTLKQNRLGENQAKLQSAAKPNL